MPFNIVSNTDIAAVPFAKEPRYCFAITPEDRGWFAGLLTQTELRDPANEKANIEKLAGQFAHLPAERMRDDFLAGQATHYLDALPHAAHAPAGLINELVKPLPAEAAQEILSASALTDREASRAALTAAWEKHGASLRKDAKVSAELFETLARESEALGIVHPAPAQAGPPCSTIAHFTPEQVSSALAMKAAPRAEAARHYAQLHAGARELPYVTPAHLYHTDVDHILQDYPAYLTQTAKHTNMNLIVAADGTHVPHIVPGNAGFPPDMPPEALGGVSTGFGAYAREHGLFGSGNTVPEEIIHEVDKYHLNGGHFTGGAAWRQALARDVNAALANASSPQAQALRHVTQVPIFSSFDESGMIKMNSTLGPEMQRLDPHSLASSEKTRFLEALPDVYHYERQLNTAEFSHGPVTVAGKTYNNSAELMQAALPDSWQVLEGPQPDHKLVQHGDGRIEQIAAEAEAPKGTAEIRSLRELCEERTGLQFTGRAQKIEVAATPSPGYSSGGSWSSSYSAPSKVAEAEKGLLSTRNMGFAAGAAVVLAAFYAANKRWKDSANHSRSDGQAHER